MNIDKMRSILHKGYNMQATQEQYACFFRIASFEDRTCAQEALQQGCMVFLDLSGMELSELQRMKDYMQGVCIPLACHVSDICEDYVAYFPSSVHLQIFEN